MFLLTSTLIVVSAVVYECYAEQTLKCPYDSKTKHLERIWCKRDPNDQSCCTGFTFGPGQTETVMDNGKVSVKDDGQAFTVSVTSLSLGEGVYWCGLKNGSNIIVKLAEGTFYNLMNSVWLILRWLIFVLLLLAVITTHVYCNRKKAKDFHQLRQVVQVLQKQSSPRASHYLHHV